MNDMDAAESPTNPGSPAPQSTPLSPSAEFILGRYRPVYTYAADISALGRTLFGVSLVVGGIAGLGGLMSGSVPYFVAGAMGALVALAFGYVFQTLADLSASALRIFADTAVGGSPISDPEKLAILRTTH